MASIGDDVYIGPGGYIAADGGLTIRRGVMIGPLVYIQTSTHNFESADLLAVPYDHRIIRGPICIEEYAWLGGRVTVIPGVRIGRGAIVGAGSVVTKDVPDLAVVAGNPARIVRYRHAESFEPLAARGRSHAELLSSPEFVDTWLDEQP